MSAWNRAEDTLIGRIDRERARDRMRRAMASWYERPAEEPEQEKANDDDSDDDD